MTTSSFACGISFFSTMVLVLLLFEVVVHTWFGKNDTGWVKSDRVTNLQPRVRGSTAS